MHSKIENCFMLHKKNATEMKETSSICFPLLIPLKNLFEIRFQVQE